MRRIGIEIEFGGDMQRAVQAIHQEGLSSRTTTHSYLGHSDSSWIVKPDGSVPGGGELVSPPLDFDDPDARGQIDRAIKALRDAGCTTNSRAGIHVHVDCSDLNAAQIVAVVRSYTKFEDVIYRIASSGWETIRPGSSQFARPITSSVVNAVAKAKTFEELIRAWYQERDQYEAARRTRSHNDHSRYAGLNLHSYFYRGTIEFRVFNSSLNSERIQGYMAMCVALVEDARRGNRRSITKRFALGGMVAGTTQEKAAFHRFQQVLRYEAGMSIEDMKRLTKIWKDSVPQRSMSTL